VPTDEERDDGIAEGVRGTNRLWWILGGTIALAAWVSLQLYSTMLGRMDGLDKQVLSVTERDAQLARDLSDHTQREGHPGVVARIDAVRDALANHITQSATTDDALLRRVENLEIILFNPKRTGDDFVGPIPESLADRPRRQKKEVP
jgi:hypothetical protein